MTLVDFVGVQTHDIIISLGDYVDRGPNSRAVLDWLIDRHKTGRLIPLRGNHEIMMVESRHNDKLCQQWREFGGTATLNSYSSLGGQGDLADIPEFHWQFLENDLRATFETKTHFFVHANADPTLAFNDQPEYMLYWEKYNNPPLHESGKIMVCGHTSQKSGIPLTNGNAICIDTWAYGHGWLSCLDVESGTIWQSNEAGQTRMLSLDAIGN